MPRGKPWSAKERWAEEDAARERSSRRAAELAAKAKEKAKMTRRGWVMNIFKDCPYRTNPSEAAVDRHFELGGEVREWDWPKVYGNYNKAYKRGAAIRHLERGGHTKAEAINAFDKVLMRKA